MEKMFLTNGGNLLRFHPTFDKAYFQKPSGEFIREVYDSEAEYLRQNCLEIECSVEHPKFLPTWHFIKSVLVVQDNSNYRWETCCNGGNYSFQTYHDWYVAKYPDGSWKFAFVERYSTSAEFEYDELAGNFQSDLGTLYLKNACEPCPSYSSQRGIEWRDEQEFYSSEEVVEKIGQVASFFDLWNEQYEYIPSRWDDEDEAEIVIGLSFSLKKEIITRLKELGVTRQDSKPSLRGQRRGGRR